MILSNMERRKDQKDANKKSAPIQPSSNSDPQECVN